MADGQNVSSRQRLVEQLTTKQALNYQPSERGKVWLRIDAKTQILVDKGCDMEAKRIEYKNIHEPERVVSEYKKFNKLPKLIIKTR